MKKIIALIFVFAFPVLVQSSTVVRNTGTTSRDSIVCYVNCLDSLGEPSHCDSFFVMVLKSGTNDVVWRDSGTTAMTGLDTMAYRASATPDGTVYYFHRQVSDIDGSGAEGEYLLVVAAQKVYTSGSNNKYTHTSMPFRIENWIKLDSAVFAGKFARGTDSANRIVWYNASDSCWTVTSNGNQKPAAAFRNVNSTSAAGSNGLLLSSVGQEALLAQNTVASGTTYSVRFKSASSGGYAFYLHNSNGGGSIATTDGTYDGSGIPVGYMADGAIRALSIVTGGITSTNLDGTAAAEIRDSILNRINDSVWMSKKGFGAVKGIVTGGGSDSGCYSATFTAATNFYTNKYLVHCFYGAGANQMAIVTRTALNIGDTIRWLPKFGTAIATDDSIRLIPLGALFYVGPSRIVNDSNIMLATDTGNMAGQYTKIRDSVSSVERGKYAMGAVWIGPTANTNTVSYVDGITTNPVSTIAAAKTIADALNLRRFYTIRTGTIQIGADMVGYDFDGAAWSLTTTGGSRDVSSSFFSNAQVIGGTYASTTAESHWDHCEFATGVSVAAVHMTGCAFQGTLTFTATGNYDFVDCASVVAGSNTPTFDLTAGVGAQNVGIRRWSGGLRLLNIQAGDTISVDAVSGGKVRIYGTGGSVNVRGMVAVEDSSSGSVSIVKTQVINRTEVASAARSLILTDTSKTLADSASIGRSIWDNDIVTAGNRTVQVAGIDNNAVSNGSIASGAIDATKIATDAIGSDELADAGARELASHILADTTTRLYFVAGGANADSVVIPASSGSGLDSATTSRIIGRKVWGIAAGSGSDSSTVAQRTVTTGAISVDTAAIGRSVWDNDIVTAGNRTVQVAGINGNAIDNASIASGAIDSSKIATDAIGQDELKDNGLREMATHILFDTTKRIKFSNDSVMAIDPARTVAATVAGGATESTAQKAVDSAHAIHVKLEAVRDTAHLIDSVVRAIHDTLGDTSAIHRWAGLISDSIAVTLDSTANISVVIDTTLLDKVRDTANAILDTLQNLSSTLRLAGSDLDTVYQVVQCNDTMDGDFLLTLSDYRSQIKYKMGVAQTNSTWITDSVLNQLVREAIVTVNPIMRGYKTSITRVTRFDSSDYPLDSLVGISSVLWYKDDTARSIPYLAKEKWATLAIQNTYGADDAYLQRPQVYDYTDAVISFFPTPTSEDSVKINGWAKIPNITVISAVSQIPQKYRVAILKYATFLVARAKQHPLIQTFLDEYHESVSFLLVGNNVQAPSK